jgi:hypothetical protein
MLDLWFVPTFFHKVKFFSVHVIVFYTQSYYLCRVKALQITDTDSNANIAKLNPEK